MSFANILQRRIKPRKYASEDDEASSIGTVSESEKAGSRDGVSSVESSDEGGSQQEQQQLLQHHTRRAGISHEAVRKKNLYHANWTNFC